MTTPNVYSISDPRGAGALFEEERATQSIQFQDEALKRIARDMTLELGQGREEAINFASSEVERMHAQKSPEEQLTIARDLRDRYLKMFKERGASKRRALSDAIDEGAYARPESVELSPQQRFGLEHQKGYQFTPEQAQYRYLLTLDEDEKMALLGGDAKAVAKAQADIQKLMEEKQWHAPSKSFPWYQKYLEDSFVFNAFNAIPSFGAGLYAAMRELAPSHYTRGESPEATKRMREMMALGAGKGIPLQRDPGFAGVDVEKLLSKFGDDPSLLYDIVARGLSYGKHTFLHGSWSGEPTMLSYHLIEAQQQMESQAEAESYARLTEQLGRPPKRSEHLVEQEQILEDMKFNHAGTYALEHPYITEFATAMLMPSGLPQVVGSAKIAARLGARGTKATASWVAGTKAAAATKVRVAKVLEHNAPLAAFVEATGEGLERFGKAAKKTREGFSYQSWVKRLAKDADDDELRQLVQMDDQRIIGKMDEARKTINQHVRKLLSVRNEDDARLLHYALDQPWSIATVPEVLEKGYGLIIPRLLRLRGKPGTTQQQIQAIVGSLLKDDTLTAAEKASLKPFYGPRASAAHELVADILEEPLLHVDVPERLMEAFNSGLELANIDEGIKELGGILNRWQRVKAFMRTAAAKRGMGIKPIGKGTDRRKVEVALRAERKAAKEGIPDAPSLEDLADVDHHVLRRGRTRDHWVPREDWGKAETPDPGIMAPLHKNMRHKSALARKLDLDEAVIQGLVLNPGRQFKLHFERALGKYQAGVQLRQINAIMSGKGYVVKMTGRAADGATGHAEKMVKAAAKYGDRHKAAIEVIGEMEARFAAMTKRLREAEKIGKPVVRQTGRLERRISGIANGVRRNEKAQIAKRADLEKARQQLAKVEQEIAQGTGDYQLKYRLQDKVFGLERNLRSLRNRHIKMTQRVTELELGDPSTLPGRTGARLGPLTEAETRAAGMGRQEAREYLTKLGGRADAPGLTKAVKELRKKRDALNKAILAKRIEARKLAARHQTYQDAAQIAAARGAYRSQRARQLTATKALLEQQTGTKWVDLSDGMNLGEQQYKEYLRVTGNIGDNPNNISVLVPEHYAAFLNDMMPWITGNKGKLQAAAEAYDLWMSLTLRPIQKAWRGLVTIPRMLYTQQNLVSSVGLGAVALKTRALNPELQIKALSAAFISAWDTPRAMELASGISFHLKDGVTTLDKVIDLAGQLRLTSQLEARIGTDVLSQGPLEVLPWTVGKVTEFAPAQAPLRKLAEAARAGGAAVGAPRAGAAVGAVPELAADVVKGLSPALWARATENYQHLITFMGALDDMTPLGIARAFDFSNKWSGNYNLLGPAEKTFVKDGFAFWGWYRFIYPHIARLVSERPGAVANIIRAKGGWEAYTSPYTPVSYDYMPSSIRGIALGAPEEVQGRTAGMDPDAAWLAAATMADPLSLTLGMQPFTEGLLTAGARGKSPLELLGPSWRLAIDMITLRDENGRELPPWFDGRDATTMRDSLLWRYFMGAPETPIAPIANLIKLYTNRPEQNSYRLMMTVGRQWGGLDNWVARLAGYEGRSIGGQTDPMTGGRPGVSYYPFHLRREIARSKRKAVRRAEDTIWRQERIIERGVE